MQTILPCKPILDILKPCYNKCSGFKKACKKMRWDPSKGYLPQGVCGAVGKVSEVKLVLIVAEPGNPYINQSYYSKTPRDLMKNVLSDNYYSFKNGEDIFHRNIRCILDLCWPEITFEEKLRKTLITESVLCSAETECANISASIERFCCENYLLKELDLFPKAVIATLGTKATNRLIRYRPSSSFMSAYSVSPPGCNKKKIALESWKKIANEVCNKQGQTHN
ncbi:hypothetical protein M0R36_01065 [bacterium]|jgi:hypothetical protein|nr:hypothetical protein [bacterium]